MAYNTSSAHVLTEQDDQRGPKKLQKEDLKVINTPKQFLASAATPKNICIFFMAVTVVCLMVFNNVRMTEITGQINELNAEMKVLGNEYVKLQSLQGSSLSPRAVAEKAENELGLKRLDKYQTEYLYLYHEDKIEVSGENANKGGDIQAKYAFNNAVETIKEYLASR